ncbi:TPA: hypothetical protein JZG06_004848 [Escherichia coli]|nr:hypothetical protein [Escherichia coli]
MTAWTVTSEKRHLHRILNRLAVARANNPPYQSVFADFIAGHSSCMVCFWETFHKMSPDSPYKYVTFCHTCISSDLI